jgi:trimeric autotransporter adhesin
MITGSARNWIAVNAAQQFTPKKITTMTTIRSTKPNDRSPVRHTLLLLSLTFAFAWLALAPVARAVSPPPDGGYPNFTTAEGANALQALTLGLGNTAIGTFSLFSVSTGSFNTAVGAGSLDLNTADSNTATGAAALLFNTTGTENTANGTAALEFNETGSQNIANGAFALFNNTEGNFNTANGVQALFNNTTGFRNTASGASALFNNTIGVQNTALGSKALLSNTTGNFNTAIGHDALANNTTGSNNLVLGSNGANITTANGVICIGSLGANVSSSCFIGQIRGKTTQNANAIPVVIDSADQLGTVSSSRRFKKEITPMDKASEAILGLKPVTFHYKSDDTNTPCFGLIAEEVAQVNPDLVVRDDKGEIYTVRYDAVNAMLLNEFLKEHRKVEQQDRKLEQQEATIAKQQTQIDALTAGLQKVSAQLETSQPATQVVNNP